MKTTEVNKELIGRRCECIFTGLMVDVYKRQAVTFAYLIADNESSAIESPATP